MMLDNSRHQSETTGRSPRRPELWTVWLGTNLVQRRTRVIDSIAETGARPSEVEKSMAGYDRVGHKRRSCNQGEDGMALNKPHWKLARSLS